MTKKEWKNEFESVGGDDAFAEASMVLELLADYLREHEPYAKTSIKVLDDACIELSGTIDDLLEDE